MRIKLGQINMSRCAAGMVDLSRFFVESDMDILLIQGTSYAIVDTRWPGCGMFYGMRAPEGFRMWTLTVVKLNKYGVVLNYGLSESTITVVELVHRESGFELVIANCYFRYNEGIEPHLARLGRVIG